MRDVLCVCGGGEGSSWLIAEGEEAPQPQRGRDGKSQVPTVLTFLVSKAAAPASVSLGTGTH